MNFEYAGIPVATLITALIEVLKQGEVINKKYIPYISLILGLIAGITLFSDGDVKVGILNGIYLGLMPIGIYETVDHTIEWRD